MELPITPCTRILKKANTEMHYSQEAKEQFRKALENEGNMISRKAVQLAKEDGRKTVMAKDIMKWVKPSELDTDDYIYKAYGRIYYNKETGHTCWSDQEQIKALPSKFLDNTLVFYGQIHTGVDSISKAKRIMESYEKDILDGLMEPHWAYNIYEFREWEPVEEIGENRYKLSMWFDDYDGGDQFYYGILFNPEY